MEAVVVVATAELDLKAVVAAYVGSQSGERLLACATHTNQQGIATLLANHTSNPIGKDKTKKNRKKEIKFPPEKHTSVCSHNQTKM